MEQRQYWEQHGRAFAALYGRPTLFNRVFRRGMTLRCDMAVRQVAAAPGATVLDVGCGSGHNSVLMIKSAGARSVVGVDISQEMLDLAHRLAARHGVAEQCQFIRADFLDVDLGERVFDFSIALGVLDYFKDPLPVMAKMRRHTRLAAMASFPGVRPVRMLLRKIRYGLRGCGVYAYRKGEIRELYRKAGFADCRILPCTASGYFAVGTVEA